MSEPQTLCSHIPIIAFLSKFFCIIPSLYVLLYPYIGDITPMLSLLTDHIIEQKLLYYFHIV